MYCGFDDAFAGLDLPGGQVEQTVRVAGVRSFGEADPVSAFEDDHDVDDGVGRHSGPSAWGVGR